MSNGNILSKIYYSTEGYWKGYSAIPKLAEKAKVSEDVGKTMACRNRQYGKSIFQLQNIYLDRIGLLNKPNHIHQADLLFLPHDRVGRKTYKYALVVVDIASRYKDAEPLTSKESREISRIF